MPQPQERVLIQPHGGDDTCARLALAQDTLQRFGRLRFRATGSSMLPAIAPGDILTFRIATPGDLVPGRVLLMQHEDRLVAHRLLSHQQGMLTTMGDSLRAPDAPLRMSQLLGVLEGQQRGSRSIPLDADHRRLMPRASRWLLRHVPLAHRIARQWPRLATLTA